MNRGKFKIFRLLVSRVYQSRSFSHIYSPNTIKRMSDTVQKPHLFDSLGEGTHKITEGSVTISFPKGEVFYNPVQQFNRDLSIAVIETFASHYLSHKKKRNLKGLTILEALSATGLRSIRYANEISSLHKIIANDLDPSAVNLISQNVAENAVTNPKVKDLVFPHQGDANAAMLKFKSSGVFPDVIDLDPYGSAVPFIDAAVQTIADGGLLCVTCTDLAVLCSSYPEKCLAKYGGLPMRGDVCHEAALRLILNSIENAANRYQRSMIPLMSCSIDFYARVFVKIVDSPLNAKLSSTKKGPVFKCVQCKTFCPHPMMTVKDKNKGNYSFSVNHTPMPPHCELCSSRLEVCGPLWLGPLHDTEFVKDLQKNVSRSDFLPFIGTRQRIEGFTAVISEELLEAPLFYSLPEMASFLKTSVPPLVQFRSAILNSGYQVSGSHCTPHAIKTNAPAVLIWKSLLEWARTKDQKKEFAPDSPCQKLCLSASNFEASPISFTTHPSSVPTSQTQRLQRFPENPTKNWGPLARAKKSRNSD